MIYKVHISTCPNDTFMFDAMLHHRIDTEGLEFTTRLADIEQLNEEAVSGIADITKISYAVVPHILKQYLVLNSGSALGRGNGPLVVSKKPLTKDDLSGLTVAVPGMMTTANLLLETLFPGIGDKKEYLFSEVAGAVINGEVDAGVLIHEGRFIFREKGLSLVADLGTEWEERHGLPLPLGAIAVRRSLPEDEIRKIERVLRRSVQYAFDHPNVSSCFIKEHAKELDDVVIRSHIELFVNRYSLNIGDEGRQAAIRLFGHRLTAEQRENVFVDPF